MPVNRLYDCMVYVCLYVCSSECMYVCASVHPCLPDTVEGRLQVVGVDMFAYSDT